MHRYMAICTKAGAPRSARKIVWSQPQTPGAVNGSWEKKMCVIWGHSFAKVRAHIQCNIWRQLSRSVAATARRGTTACCDLDQDQQLLQLWNQLSVDQGREGLRYRFGRTRIDANFWFCIWFSEPVFCVSLPQKILFPNSKDTLRWFFRYRTCICIWLADPYFQIWPRPCSVDSEAYSYPTDHTLCPIGPSSRSFYKMQRPNVGMGEFSSHMGEIGSGKVTITRRRRRRGSSAKSAPIWRELFRDGIS